MAFYVKLGPRGILFRIGTMIIGVAGSLVYHRAYRRRTVIPSPSHPPTHFPES